MTDAAPAQLEPPAATTRLDDLAQVIEAYNHVTEKLQRSHDALHTEVTRLRQQLAAADAQLQRSKRLAALGEMAAGIAHEVRNPLAAIHLYAGMIGEDLALTPPNATAAADNAARIADAVRGLNAIVTDVLHFARELHPRRTAIDAEALFRRAVAAHRPAIERAEVEVRLAAAGVTLYGDPDLMHQALLNLVRNAVDAMGDRDLRRVLTLRACCDRRGAVITVADTGPGIAAPDTDRLFNPFFTTRSTGTGLGLAIVHRILDAHDGSIAVHNDAGAVFTLTLPDAAGDAPRQAAPGGKSCFEESCSGGSGGGVAA